MVTTHTLPQEVATPHSAIRELIRGEWNWKNGAAAFGLAAGFIAPIVGSIVTVISWFRDPVWHGLALHQASTGLFVIVLPLLVFGAHCLDLLDKEKEVKHADDVERD